LLEDKVAGYLFTSTENYPAPKIFCCLTDADDLFGCLSTLVPKNVNGVVIKATNFHSNQGVYVLTSNPDISADPSLAFNLLDNTTLSYNDVVASLSHLQASKIIVEELIGTSLPTEYKFHIVNGEVASIDIIDKRGTGCACYAVVDKNWLRLDHYGCFEPGGMEVIDEETSCTSIDFSTGGRRAGPVKKDLYTCNTIPTLPKCVLQDMIDIALDLGRRIGVYIRVDMFEVDGKVYVQEYSANHMNGLRHCAAKLQGDGCIDSCFMGRLWNKAGAPFGGNVTKVPSSLLGFSNLSPPEQCGLVSASNISTSFRSNCVEEEKAL
jgi:hypothetical protein